MSQKKIKAPATQKPDYLKDLAPHQIGAITEYSTLIRQLCLKMAHAVYGQQITEPGKFQAVPTSWEHGAKPIQDLVDDCVKFFATRGRGKLGIRELIMIMGTVAGQQMGLALGHMVQSGKPLPPGHKQDIQAAPQLFEAAFLTSIQSAIDGLFASKIH